MVTEMFPNPFSVANLKIAVQKKQMPIQFVFVNEFFFYKMGSLSKKKIIITSKLFTPSVEAGYKFGSISDPQELMRGGAATAYCA